MLSADSLPEFSLQCFCLNPSVCLSVCLSAFLKAMCDLDCLCWVILYGCFNWLFLSRVVTDWFVHVGDPMITHCRCVVWKRHQEKRSFAGVFCLVTHSLAFAATLDCIVSRKAKVWRRETHPSARQTAQLLSGPGDAQPDSWTFSSGTCGLSGVVHLSMCSLVCEAKMFWETKVTWMCPMRGQRRRGLSQARQWDCSAGQSDASPSSVFCTLGT